MLIRCIQPPKGVAPGAVSAGAAAVQHSWDTPTPGRRGPPPAGRRHGGGGLALLIRQASGPWGCNGSDGL